MHPSFSPLASVSTFIALAVSLSCSSPDDASESTQLPAGFDGMPGAMQGGGGSGTPMTNDGSAPPLTGMTGTPTTPSTETPTPTQVSMPVGMATVPIGAPLCSAKLRVQNPTIADFESYDGTVEAAAYTFYFGAAPNAGVLAGVFAFDDMTSMTRRFGILAGRNGGWGASQQITQATAWGGGMGLWFDCVDASAFAGISFWVRGSTAPGTFSVTASFLATSAANAADARGGGTCTGGAELCVNPSLDAIPLTLDWTLVEIPWTSLTTGLVEGQAFVPTGDELMSLTFGLPIAWGPDPSFVDNPNDMTDMPTFLPLPSDIIFQIDDINFMPR
jgi:hypothetical protein